MMDEKKYMIEGIEEDKITGIYKEVYRVFQKCKHT